MTETIEVTGSWPEDLTDTGVLTPRGKRLAQAIKIGDKLFCYMDGEGHFEAVTVLKSNLDSTYTVRYTGGSVIRVVSSRLYPADKAKELFERWLEVAFDRIEALNRRVTQ